MTHPADDFDPCAQPHCPECATVLRPAGVGEKCPACQLVFIGV